MKKVLTWRLIIILSIPILFISMFQLNTITSMVKQQNIDRKSYHNDIHESIVSRVDTIFDTVEKTTITYAQSIWVQEYFQRSQLSEERKTSLTNIKEVTLVSGRFNPEIVDVMLVQSGKLESVIGYSPKKIEDMVKNLVVQWESKQDSRNIFYFITDDFTVPSTYIIHMMPVFSSKSDPLYEPIGYVSVICTVKSLYNILNSNEHLYCEISSLTNGTTFLSSAEKPTESISDEAKDFVCSQVQQKNLLLRTHYFPEQALLTDSQRSLIVPIAFSLIYALYCWVAINAMILRPIRVINNEINKTATAYPNNQIIYSSNNEIGSIAVCINQMLDKINDLNENIMMAREKLYKAQLQKSKTLLYAFHSQVAPHFLFNTLQCIRSKALMADMMEIADMCGNVSQTLRYVLSSDEIVTIEEELGVIKRYLDIISIRFPGKISYEIHVAEDVDLNYHIPKMILQPLAENAIYHGLEPLRDQGRLIIHVEVKDVLRIYLIDDGVGFEQTRLQALKEQLASADMDLTFTKDGSEKIGLVNVHNRIRLFFGMQYGLGIEQSDHKTVVFITLPLHEPDNLEMIDIFHNINFK